MTKAILQSVKFNAKPEELFELYLDAKKYSASTGSPVKISRKVGGAFQAFGGAISGRNLLILRRKMIVQAWRSTHFKSADPDSILVLCFSKAHGGSRVDLVQVNVARQDHKGVTQGWPKYYWKPWKRYLAGR
ncbi:MAG TPA: SRPBCC domain-containing protein [Candidatus Acidoferrales bacterium]|nr:SRPBCC domain-containing protein [Candidatus Acidoferrales bacterium]